MRASWRTHISSRTPCARPPCADDVLLAGVGREALGGPPREEAERNGYAWDAHIVPRAARRLPLAARQAQRGQAHIEVKRTARSSTHQYTPRSRQPREPLCHTRRPAHTRSSTRPRASRAHACVQEELLPELRSSWKLCGRDGQEGAVARVIDRDSKERAGHILSREAVGGGADLKANDSQRGVSGDQEGLCKVWGWLRPSQVRR